MSTTKTAVVIGAGPGLGMSVAHRFGREGYAVALISRTDTRHADYVAALAEAGVEAQAFTADVVDRDRLRSALDTATERFGTIDVVYYGPGAADPDAPLKPITGIGSDDAREAMSWVYPAVDVVEHVLPGMVGRGEGGLLFAGGLSAVHPMPPLGALAIASAALRNYAVTLHAGLADQGVYAGNLTIGGLVERGDIHRLVKSQPEKFGDVGDKTLDPDDIADEAWRLFTGRDRAEAVFSAFAAGVER
ncbi:NADP-dependent 3-hydroxy acid dehydrogenase YdfG [Saccharothrix tamanrassetensis]|uniref:NADP-dependent 3-hydroxy acid dehydrogenase YdfG n=1 Tax=Saccharothrix tamanrassetensis TaxID=1051531 RepID=A0A841CLU5_9PSEU|nr:SDR family NAD(P)-dependent oxidoreductase [Saccharothrix tamanrassetensis]MBB5958080.1 NADP-dependent 3-hydroxy acid dehydrogenase YdfG [Saccharothrix tamanrassetensis]